MKEKCPIRLRDLMRSAGLFRNQKFRGNRGASTGRRPYSGITTRKVTSSDTGATAPATTGDYRATQIATIEESPEDDDLPQVGESVEIFEELDFNTMDEATIAALYEEIRDIPIEMPRQDDSDFPEGQ